MLIAGAPEYEAIITDPIWPNHSKVFQCDDSAALLWNVLIDAPKSVKRAVIVLGADSDPRWLREAVPRRYPYLKNCFLEFVCPSKKGRNLYTNLTAYAFGEWPKSKPGARVIPSKCIDTESAKRLTWHPTPMRVKHCQWLVKWFGDGGVIDPFAGSGSFGVACKRMRIPYIGFEKNKEYAQKANERIMDEPEPFL